MDDKLEENLQLQLELRNTILALRDEITMLRGVLAEYEKNFYDQIINRNSVKFKTLMRKIDDEVESARLANIAAGRIGSVRVARIMGRYKPAPEAPGFITINVTSMNSKSVGAELSPFRLKTSEGYIMENVWQFSKFYDVIDSVSGADETAWSYEFEQHSDNGTPNANYWIWRDAGFKFPYPVRYPVGKGKKPICSIWEGKHLGYIDARKQIYIPIYTQLAKATEDYAIIKHLVNSGYNVQLMDFDGPPIEMTESMYAKVKNIKHFELSTGTMIVDKSNWNDLINCEHIILGHGFVLASIISA